MAVAAKLRDVEAQLSRVTQVVQLHVQMTDTIGEGGEGGPEELSALVKRVERAQNELQTATAQFLVLVQHLRPQTQEKVDDEDTETEDEFEASEQVQVKVEKQEVLGGESGDMEENSNVLDTVHNTAEEKCEVETQPTAREECQLFASFVFLKYVFGVPTIKRRPRKIPNKLKDVEYMITHLKDSPRSAFSAVLKDYAFAANSLFLRCLRCGNVMLNEAVKFADVSVAVSMFLIRVESDLRKHSWIMQFVHYLTSICAAAKTTQFADVLSPLEQCRDDIVIFCCETFSNDVDDALRTCSDRFLKPRKSDHNTRINNQKSHCVNATKNDKMLEVYLRSAAEVKSATSDKMQDQEGDTPQDDKSRFALKKWSVVVQEFCQDANLEFLFCLVRHAVDRELALSFAEGTTHAVSIVTTKAYGFQPEWVLQAVMALDAISKLAEGSILASALQPVRDGRNALLRYCESMISGCLDELASSITHYEAEKPKQVGMRVAKIFHRTLLHYVLSSKLGDTTPWTEEQWKSVSGIGLTFAKWTEMEIQTLQAKEWYKMRGCFEEFDAQFPGRLPEAVLLLWDKLKTARNDTSATPRLKRSLPETEAEYPASKRVLMGNVEESNLSAPVEHYLGLILDLRAKFVAGNVPLFSMAKDARMLLSRAIQVNKIFVDCNGEVDEATMMAFSEASDYLSRLYCLSLWDCTGRSSLTCILRQFTSIVKKPKSLAPIVPSLAVSRSRLQEYWTKHFANPFESMRRHIEETEKLFPELDPRDFEDRVRQLIRKLCDSCESSLVAARKESRIEEVRANLMEISLVLTRWLERVETSNFEKESLSLLLSKLNRLELGVPASIPDTLLRKVKELI